ncbi:hypothetical protein P5673_028890 [Acropora cervicornis]|uniref:Uncharacterized protein n=1 Tax=Acropora cervicornis TaxID=6130 RepID=A0AAD9PWI1_ACRCE|nr:hypothetical protein P5673_028890 [Acropora cervicornis]
MLKSTEMQELCRSKILENIQKLDYIFLLGRPFDPKSCESVSGELLPPRCFLADNYSQNGRSIQLTEPGGKPKIYRDGPLLTKSDGQWNGTIVNVSFFLQEEINKPFEKITVSCTFYLPSSSSVIYLLIQMEEKEELQGYLRDVSTVKKSEKMPYCDMCIQTEKIESTLNESEISSSPPEKPAGETSSSIAEPTSAKSNNTGDETLVGESLDTLLESAGGVD